MKTLQHVNNTPGRRRVLDATTLASVGISVDESLVWEPANNHLVTVSNEKGETLLKAFPGEFIEIDPDEVEEPEVEAETEPWVETTPEPSTDDEDDESSEEGEDD